MYQYYAHGPLARTTLGKLNVQGLDYIYTLQGWLKGVNPAMGGSLTNGTDTTEPRPIAQDVFGFSLHYYKNDYKAIWFTPQSSSVLGALTTNAKPLYNGNIAAMAVNIPQLGNTKVYNYKYDQLNRLVSLDMYNGLNPSAGSFTPAGTTEYRERISYDPNGNILTYQRNGDAARLTMDNLGYSYTTGTNRLHKVTDAAADAGVGSYANYNDLRTGQANNNYGYDAIGNLIRDTKDSISNISWTVYGKIDSITRNAKFIRYTYDAAGNRISKQTATDTTFYVRDATGNVMSVYVKPAGGSLRQEEVHLYGSNRLGIATRHLAADTSINLAAGFGTIKGVKFTRGEKLFELSNHLGNVLVTISDRMIQQKLTGDTVRYYQADVVSANDYYPFGMQMPGRKFSAGVYRYGFNGKENDNEVKGVGNSYTAEFWEYDPRTGRRWNTDPIVKDFESPYATFSNNPIWFADPEGADTTKSGIAARLDELLNGGKAKNDEKIQMLQAGIKNQAEEVLKNRNLKQNAFNNMMGSELGSIEAKTNSELYSRYEAAEQEHSKALTWMLGQIYRAERHDDNIKNYNNYVSTQLNVLIYGSNAMLTAASFIPSGGSSGYFTFVGMSGKEIAGGMKQWLRFGYSYSKAGLTPSVGFRWGAGGGFGKTIGSLWLRGANETLRGKRLIPGLKTWWNEPGHLHLIKMPNKSFFGKISMEGIKTIL
ncbi:hypothetical protein BC349_10910 [Flavihumibacter stibioxidans]|uniref:RHS repeat-associated core domain-containing protein n=1 Tax=Flavihumibacter stibioxidans TaxID=1834163 RepID=A0ABR7M9Z5_9BACT|nr:hypothetical protein [Flavihumibacter stibioxidans]